MTTTDSKLEIFTDAGLACITRSCHALGVTGATVLILGVVFCVVAYGINKAIETACAGWSR